MKNEEQPSAWPSVEKQLREEAKRGGEFPPLLHRRIMAAVREEAQRKAQPKWVIFNWARLALASVVAGLALFFALTPNLPTAEERAGSQLIGEWIATAAHSDQQVANLISDKMLTEWMTQPYQQHSHFGLRVMYLILTLNRHTSTRILSLSLSSKKQALQL